MTAAVVRHKSMTKSEADAADFRWASAQFVASLRNTAITGTAPTAPYIAEACRATALHAQLTSLLINYAGTPVSKGFRADTIT